MPFARDLDQQVSALTDQLHTALDGGIDFSEIIGLLMQGTVACARMAQQYQDIPEARKQRVVTQALRRVYLSRRIDLPLIPEPFETMLETLLFTEIVPQLYAALAAQPAAALAERDE